MARILILYTLSLVVVLAGAGLVTYFSSTILDGMALIASMIISSLLMALSAAGTAAPLPGHEG